MENKSNFHCSNFFLLYNELLGPQSLHCLSSSLISSLLIKNFISIGNVITKKRTNHCASIEFISIYLSNITSVKMIQVVISHRSFDSFHKLMKLMQMCANKCKCGILNAFLDDQRTSLYKNNSEFISYELKIVYNSIAAFEASWQAVQLAHIKDVRAVIQSGLPFYED